MFDLVADVLLAFTISHTTAIAVEEFVILFVLLLVVLVLVIFAAEPLVDQVKENSLC
jgi:hypothetical protein